MRPETQDPATLLKCIAERTGGELHIKHSEVEAVAKKALLLFQKDGKTIVRTGTAERLVEWPEDETRIDIIGSNGPTGEHYSEVGK